MRLFMRVSIGQQRNVIMLTLSIAIPNAIGGVAYRYFQKENQTSKFRKINNRFVFLAPKSHCSNFRYHRYFSKKKPFLDENS